MLSTTCTIANIQSRCKPRVHACNVGGDIADVEDDVIVAHDPSGT